MAIPRPVKHGLPSPALVRWRRFVMKQGGGKFLGATGGVRVCPGRVRGQVPRGEPRSQTREALSLTGRASEGPGALSIRRSRIFAGSHAAPSIIVVRHHTTAANARGSARMLPLFGLLWRCQPLLTLMLAPPTQKFLAQRRLVG